MTVKYLFPFKNIFKFFFYFLFLSSSQFFLLFFYLYHTVGNDYNQDNHNKAMIMIPRLLQINGDIIIVINMTYILMKIM